MFCVNAADRAGNNGRKIALIPGLQINHAIILHKHRQRLRRQIVNGDGGAVVGLTVTALHLKGAAQGAASLGIHLADLKSVCASSSGDQSVGSSEIFHVSRSSTGR